MKCQEYFCPYRSFHGKLWQLLKKEVDMRIFMITVMLALWLAAPGWADNSFKEGAREVGQGVKEGSKKVGQGFKEMGKEIKEGGKEAGQGAKKAGQEAKKTGRSTGEWFRDAGKKTGDAFGELGRNIRKFFTGK
jgi:hypothetical protein